MRKSRSVVSDSNGQYRIVDLRPGTYSVTFTLPGFTTLKRDGIELSGIFVATLNGELKVGALEETITVTGETPIVDVQSCKGQHVVSKDILAAIPSSRNAGGIQALVPGMSTAGGFRQDRRRNRRAAPRRIHGGRGNDSRTYADGINMGWAGGSGGGGNMPADGQRAGSGPHHVGRPGRSRDGRRGPQRHPARGGNTFSGQFIFSGANGALQGNNYTQALKDAGLTDAVGAH